MKVGIICAQGLEECEGLIVYDLLYRAGIDVKLIGLDSQITSSHKLTFNVDVNINDFDYTNYDCLVLPGGMPGTNNLEENKQVQTIIDYFVEHNKLIAAICAAPSILIHKGLLKNDKFICFPGFENDLQPAKNTKVYKDDNFITAKGLGAAFEFAYEIIQTLLSKDKADEIFKKIQY